MLRKGCLIKQHPRTWSRLLSVRPRSAKGRGFSLAASPTFVLWRGARYDAALCKSVEGLCVPILSG